MSRIGRRLTGLLPRRSDWQAMRRSPLRDLTAGLSVAVVALPLALAFGAASGLGASAGLVTAIVAGALAAVFGGSNVQVSGPTGAMTVVLIPIAHQHGANGVLTVGVMAGALLVVMALLRLGRLTRLLPKPVIEGFTMGIAVVIGLQQLPAALGISNAGGDRTWATAWAAVVQFGRSPQWAEAGMAAVVATAILVVGRWRPRLPVPIGVVAVAAVAAQVAGLDVARIGATPAGLPTPIPSFLDPGTVLAVLPAALAVAALGALESLLSASVADDMSGQVPHDPNRELFGQGLANIAAPLFGGVPATGAIARTAVNVRANATSRLAALTHSAVLLVVMVAGSSLVTRIPLAALAGVLFATAASMVRLGALRTIVTAHRGDAFVLVLTLVVTVAVDLVAGVVAGVALATALALRDAARAAVLVPIDLAGVGISPASRLLAFEVVGPISFASADRVMAVLTGIPDRHTVILRLSHSPAPDTTGLHALAAAVGAMRVRHVDVILAEPSVAAGPASAQLFAVGAAVFADFADAVAYGAGKREPSGVRRPNLEPATTRRRKPPGTLRRQRGAVALRGAAVTAIRAVGRLTRGTWRQSRESVAADEVCLAKCTSERV